jgi:transcription termination factor NusB
MVFLSKHMPDIYDDINDRIYGGRKHKRSSSHRKNKSSKQSHSKRKTMKSTFILLFSILISSISLSQEFDKRLEKAYTSNQLTTMQKENPAQLKMLNYALDNALYVIDMPKEKMSEIQKSITYDLKKKATFLELGLTIQKENQYLKINGLDKVLVVKSEWMLLNELNSRR